MFRLAQAFMRRCTAVPAVRSTRMLNTDVPLPKTIDTHKLKQRFLSAEFTPSQGEGLMEMCTEPIQDCLQEQRSSELQLLGKTDFALLKTEVALLEKRMLAEIANVRTEVERIENRFMKWAVGASFSIAALLMAYSRLRMSSG